MHLDGIVLEDVSVSNYQLIEKCIYLQVNWFIVLKKGVGLNVELGWRDVHVDWRNERSLQKDLGWNEEAK